MIGLQLFRVTVSETFVVEGDALVWAASKDEAMKAAKETVELDIHDADSVGVETMASIEPIDNLLNFTKRQADDYWLIAPGLKPGYWDTLDLDQFRALLDSERMEQARLAAIERNNGQLALLEAVA